MSTALLICVLELEALIAAWKHFAQMWDQQEKRTKTINRQLINEKNSNINETC